MAAGTIFDICSLGTSSNQITFNDDSQDPYFQVNTRTPTNREIEEFNIKLPEGTGDADFQTFIGRTYLVLQGTMFPNDESSYNSGRQGLRKLASLDIQQDDADSDDGYVPFKFQANVPQQIFLKVLYADLPESVSNGIKQPFRLFCKIKYPVIFAQTSVSTSVGSAAATTSGSSGYPFEYPVLYGATTYSSNGSIANNGDLPTYPSITITGPINRPKITNSTTGEFIEVDVNMLSSSDTLTLDYDQDSLEVNENGSSVLASLTDGSTFFKIKPGTNNLTLSGLSVGDGANATVSINPAWPLS